MLPWKLGNIFSCMLTPFLSFSSPGISGLRHSEFGSLCTEAGLESITFPSPRGGINSTPGVESIPPLGVESIPSLGVESRSTASVHK